MSWKLQALVSERICGSMARKMILINMASRANDDGTGIYAALPTLALWCEINVSTVRRTVRELEADGVIFVSGKRAVAAGWVYDWSINIAAIEALPLAKDEIQKARAAKAIAKATPGTVQPLAGRHPLAAATPGTEEPVAPCVPTPGMAPPKPILEPISSSEPKGSSEESCPPKPKKIGKDDARRLWAELRPALSEFGAKRGKPKQLETLLPPIIQRHGYDAVLGAARRFYAQNPDCKRDGGVSQPGLQVICNDGRLEEWIERGAEVIAIDTKNTLDIEAWLASGGEERTYG